jgi:hypothetical protein
MSTVKISQLPLIGTINANTSNTLFAGVDVPSDTTGKISAHTLAQGLYSNEILNVGGNPVTLSNTVAQFASSDPTFLQVNLQNFSPTSSGDYIVTADTGTNTGGYIDLGINNSQYNAAASGQTSQYPLDGYLFVDGPGNGPTGNLVVGTVNPGTNLVFTAGGLSATNIVAKVTSAGLVMNTATSLQFGDGSQQVTAAASLAYTQAAYAQANSANAMNWVQVGVDTTQNTEIGLAWNLANTSLQNTTNIIIPGNVTITGSFTTTGNDLNTGNRVNNGNTIFNGLVSANNNFVANGTSIFNGPINLNGLTSFIGDSVHTGNLTTNGIVVANGAFVANGTSTFNGNMIVNGNTTRNGNTIVNGAMTWNGNTTTNGTSTVNGTLFNNGNTYNNGITYLQGQLLPNTSGISIGSPTAPFQNIYTSNSTVLLSNTNFTVSGNLTSNGTSTFNGPIYVENSSYNANIGSVEIIGSAGFAMVPPAANGCMVHITGLDGVTTKTLQDNFGSGGTYSVYTGRSARGTAASPTPTQSGDIISRFAGTGYGTSGFSSTQTSYMQVVAAENYSDTNKGTQLVFATIPVGSNTTTTALTLNTSTATFANNVFVTNNTTSNTVIANTLVYGSATANSMVTQGTSKSTAVTANGVSGQITMYGATAMNHQTSVEFTVNNSYVQHVNDIVLVGVQNSQGGQYIAGVSNTRIGSFDVTVQNMANAGAANDNRTDAVILNWSIIRVGS